METTRETIRQFVETNFYLIDPRQLADDDSLIDGGIVDSTGVLEVVAFLEQRFGIHVEDADMVPENLDSIARIEAFVGRALRRPTQGTGSNAPSREQSLR